MIRIGTRGSALALWQARTVAAEIEQTTGHAPEIVVIRTSGDESQGPPDAEQPLNVKATFVKQIEDALLDGRVDLGVHSSKDLPAVLPEGLRLAAAIPRGDPRDALILPVGRARDFADAARGPVQRARDFPAIVGTLGPHPRLGTSSVRRMAQLRSLIPSARFLPIRGNVDTRLRKLDAGECDALVLAAAGLERLGLGDRISLALEPDVCLPAPGQGIVAIETSDRASADLLAITAALNDPDTWDALMAERALVRELGGGCQMPLGALATVDGQRVNIYGVVISVNVSQAIRASAAGNRGNAAAAGERLAALLLEKGAGRLLRE